MGGPIVRDKSLVLRHAEVPRVRSTAVPNVRANANMNNSAWEYIPNDAVEVRASNSTKIGQVRLSEPGDATAQVQLLHRLAGGLRGRRPDGPAAGVSSRATTGLHSGSGWASASPEAAGNWDDRERILPGQLSRRP